MTTARIGIVPLLLVPLALSVGPCWARSIFETPEEMVAGSDVIALCEAAQGNITPDTVFQAPEGAPPDFDFHVRPMVTLRVIDPLQGCRPDDMFQIPTPMLGRHGMIGPTFLRPAPPLFINDGQQLLAYLRSEQGWHVAQQVVLVQDGKLDIEFAETKLDATGRGTRRWWEELPVAEGLELLRGLVRRHQEAQAYPVRQKTSVQLVEDFGDNQWLNQRIIDELGARGDAPALGTLLGEADDVTKVSIAKALGQVPGRGPVPYLIDLLPMPYAFIYDEAINGLARPEGAAAVPALIEALGGRRGSSPVSFRLPRVAKAIAAIGDPRGMEAVLKAASDPHASYLLSSTIKRLAASRDPQVDAFLLARLRGPIEVWTSPDEYRNAEERELAEHSRRYGIMLAAAKALAQRGNDAGFDRLMEFLEEWWHGEPALRHDSPSIVWALGELGDRRAVPALLAVLADPPEQPHSQAGVVAGVLVKLGDERAIGPLLEAVRERQGNKRASMVRLVGQWDRPAIRAMLTAELNGEDQASMFAAALALHKLGVAEAADRLLALLAGDLAGWEREQRSRLYDTLYAMKELRAVPGLAEAMRSDPENAHFIPQMLRYMTGVELPDSPEVWLAWWERARSPATR